MKKDEKDERIESYAQSSDLIDRILPGRKSAVMFYFRTPIAAHEVTVRGVFGWQLNLKDLRLNLAPRCLPGTVPGLASLLPSLRGSP